MVLTLFFLGNVLPWWYFSHEFEGGSIVRIVNCSVDANWEGFAFCVAFEVTNPSAFSGSSHNSFLTPLSSPLYLSFESEQAEESFHMPFCLYLPKDEHFQACSMGHGSSKHVWIIYISRPHCHFVKSAARITFKACSGLEPKKWGLRMVFKQDIVAMKRELQSAQNQGIYYFTDDDFSSGPKIQLLDYRLDTEDVHESSSSTGPKIQLPFNWLVTDEEENEYMEAKAKEVNLFNVGL